MKRFSTLKSQFSNPSGLTLVELLITLSILIVIIAVLWAIVDPLQQQYKTSDAVSKSTIVEFEQGALRYGSAANSYPWNQTSCLSLPTPTLAPPTATPTPTPSSSCPYIGPCVGVGNSCPSGCTCAVVNPTYSGVSICSSTYNPGYQTACTGFSCSQTGVGIFDIAAPTPTPTPLPTIPPSTPTPAAYVTLPAGTSLSSLSGCIGIFQNQGDLKSSLNQVPSEISGNILVFQPDPNTSTNLQTLLGCFKPLSNAARKDALYKYTSAGLPTCDPSTNSCYICISQ